MEFHQCERSDMQFELQTLSTFQQCKMTTPFKRQGCVCTCQNVCVHVCVCVFMCARFDIQGENRREERGDGCPT